MFQVLATVFSKDTVATLKEGENNNEAKILVGGILDTKGEEIKYLAEQVKAAGGEPVIIELSVGAEVGWADIGLSKILDNRKNQKIFSKLTVIKPQLGLQKVL